jgi:hypothetical protein
MAEARSNASMVLLAGGAIAAYFFWPDISAWFQTAGATTVPQSNPNPGTLLPGQPSNAQTTNNSPIINADGSCVPGATPLGPDCCSYAGNVDCLPGSSPPKPNPVTAACQTGWTADSAGICTQYTDSQLIAGFNTIMWTGPANIPAEQIARIDPAILAAYTSVTAITPGSVLAYMLGLGGPAPDGTTQHASDGNNYLMQNGMYVREATATTTALAGLGRRGIGRLGSLSAALPVTNGILMRASWDPTAAAILGTDPRGMLTVPQWNYFYSQASGILQTRPTHPLGQQGAKVTALQYQALRTQAGLSTMTSPGQLGMIRSSRPGAFPLGSIRPGASRTPYVHPQNHTIYRIPGTGQVVERRMGTIQNGGGNHRWARSPFPRPSYWRNSE